MPVNSIPCMNHFVNRPSDLVNIHRFIYLMPDLQNCMVSILFLDIPSTAFQKFQYEGTIDLLLLYTLEGIN